MNKCSKCKHKRVTDGFVECGAVWLHPYSEIKKHFKKAGRLANGYDFALEYGKFREECPYFEKRISWWNWFSYGNNKTKEKENGASK